MDPSGRKMLLETRSLINTHILKERSSPLLIQEDLFEVVDTTDEVMDCAELKVSDLSKTRAFPVKRRGIAEGGNTLWSAGSLSTNFEYPHPLSTPKPDFHMNISLVKSLIGQMMRLQSLIIE